MKSTTAEWVRKAEVDYRSARKLAPSRPPMHDLVCFHCQQSAEKYLKAILNEQGVTIPRTHNLEDLLGLLLPIHLELGALRRGLKFLIQFAVEVRYPGFHATKSQATSALRRAGRIPRRLPHAPGHPPAPPALAVAMSGPSAGHFRMAAAVRVPGRNRPAMTSVALWRLTSA